MDAAREDPCDASAPADAARAELVAELQRQFALLRGKQGLSAGEAAAAALLVACGASPPPLDAGALEAASQAFVAEWRAAGGNVAPAARAAFAASATAAFSPDALSRSFLLPADVAPPADAAAAPAAAALSLDVDAAARAFGALDAARAATDAATDAALQAALSAALDALEPPPHGRTGTCKHPGATARVALLLLLACEPLRDPSLHALLRRLLRTLAALPPGARRLAALAMRTLPKDRFVALLDALQGFLLTRLYEFPGGASEPLRSCATKWLYDANEAAAAPHVSPSAFHCDALNEASWAEPPPRPAHAPPGAPPPGPHPLADDHAAWRGGRFSFCAFAFLYSPRTKSHLFALENAHRQREEFNAALMRAMLGGYGNGFQDALLAAAAPFCVFNIRRTALLADAAEAVAAAARTGALHLPLKVNFVGEAGLDAGGLQKEFFNMVARAIFSPDYGMFSHSDAANRITWFAHGGLDMASESEYELVGRILGLALFHGHLLELALPRVAYKMLLGGTPQFADLADCAPEVHASLSALIAAAEADPDSVEADFALTWTAGYEAAGSHCTAELCAGGGERAVTGGDAVAYAHAYAYWFLVGGVARQFAAFAAGFRGVAASGPPPRALSLLRPEELEALLCGDPHLDFTALEASAEYADGLTTAAPLARAFWRVAHALSEPDKKRLLAFVTASDRVPIGGLAALPFRLVRNGTGDERLPTAHTCFNTLLLPEYSSEDVLRERLALVLTNAEGFGLR